MTIARPLSLAGVLGRDPTDVELVADWYNRLRLRAQEGVRSARATSPLNWSEAEIQGLADAVAMAELVGDLPLPPWLERMHGIRHAAKSVYALIALDPDESMEGLVQRFDGCWRPEWAGYVDELIAASLVVRAGTRMRVVRRAA